MRTIDLSAQRITVVPILHNPPPALLYEEAIRHEPGAAIAANGALVAYSGPKTGRSPSDKRIVRHPLSEKDIWWGPVNPPLEHHSFAVNRERARDWLNTRSRLFCVDGFAGWDPEHRLKVRVICCRPYHALFMHNLLIRPSPEELAFFGEPDFVIYNAGEFPANPFTVGMTSRTSIDISFEDHELVILGTEYAGEMKKGIFTVMNYLMPKRGVLSMHCSATVDRDTGKSSLLFGLSGTGKTTLSADPKRFLIGDDEHCWTDRGIFNIEGGCYAKTIDLSPESEPDIYQALRFGAVLENVVLKEESRQVSFEDARFTQNTRGAYPIEFIPNARVPCVADHPTDIIFLTCDAFGVLPPVARLTPHQAMYHFISGYTAKIPGTEVGITVPQATFSPCFGGPFLACHPTRYADLLAGKMLEHRTHVWLVNTGWSGGAFGKGRRMRLSLTRAIIDAIHAGTLREAPVTVDPLFGFEVVTRCHGVPDEVLLPRSNWADPEAYDAAARNLAAMFRKNFERFAAEAPDEVRAAGPK